MQKWSRLTGIDNYSDSSKKPRGNVLDSYWDLNNCNSFCRQWQVNNREQLECLSGQDVKMIYCSVVGPDKYDLKFAIGKSKIINWFGSACCSYAAVAKAYQSYYNECY